MKPVAFAAITAIGVATLAACEMQEGEQPTALNEAAEIQRDFNRADRNGDGALSRDEAMSIADLDFTEADTNANQNLSIEEYEVAALETTPRG